MWVSEIFYGLKLQDQLVRLGIVDGELVLSVSCPHGNDEFPVVADSEKIFVVVQIDWLLEWDLICLLIYMDMEKVYSPIVTKECLIDQNSAIRKSCVLDFHQHLQELYFLLVPRIQGQIVVTERIAQSNAIFAVDHSVRRQTRLVPRDFAIVFHVVDHKILGTVTVNEIRCARNSLFQIFVAIISYLRAGCCSKESTRERMVLVEIDTVTVRDHDRRLRQLFMRPKSFSMSQFLSNVLQ